MNTLLKNQCQIFQVNEDIEMYLSIDLDYWNHQGGIKSLKRVISAVKDSGKLRQICDNHKYLLKSIKASGQDHIINIDTHSDIVDLSSLEYWKKEWDGKKSRGLNCGTWANFIPRKLRNVYEWYYPDGFGLRCDWKKDEKDSIFNFPYLIGFNFMNMKKQSRFPMHLIDDASDIGISISYYYLDELLSVEKVQSVLKHIFGRKIPQREFDCY